MMDPKLKTDWLAALRGGAYAQNDGEYLRTAAGLNALGVLCDVTDPDGWQPPMPDSTREWEDFSEASRTVSIPAQELPNHRTMFSHVARLPVATRYRLGIPPEDHSQLVRMSDEGFPFDLIADYVEQHL